MPTEARSEVTDHVRDLPKRAATHPIWGSNHSSVPWGVMREPAPSPAKYWDFAREAKYLHLHIRVHVFVRRWELHRAGDSWESRTWVGYHLGTSGLKAEVTLGGPQVERCQQFLCVVGPWGRLQSKWRKVESSIHRTQARKRGCGLRFPRTESGAQGSSLSTTGTLGRDSWLWKIPTLEGGAGQLERMGTTKDKDLEPSQNILLYTRLLRPDLGSGLVAGPITTERVFCPNSEGCGITVRFHLR